MEEAKYKLYIYDTYSSGLRRLLKTERTNWLPIPNQTQPWIGPGPTTVPYSPYTSPSTPYNPMYPQCDWTVRPETQPFYGTTNTLNQNYCAK